MQDKKDDWIAKFKGGEDPEGKYVHYPNWKPGSKDGSSATGAFGYLKKGHLKTAWSSPHFKEIRKQYGNNYNEFWKAVRSDSYGTATTKARDRAYAGWLIEKTGGDIVKAAKFNLTGNTEGKWATESDAANNMDPNSYARKISGTKVAGNKGTGNYESVPTVNVDAPKGRKLGRKYNNPFKGGRLDGRAIIPNQKQTKAQEYEVSANPDYANKTIVPDGQGPGQYYKPNLEAEASVTDTPRPNFTQKKGTRTELDYKQRLGALDKVLPFMPNVATAVQTPPAVPNPHLDTPVALQRVNMDNDREEVRRAARGANLSLDNSLDANTAAAAKSNVLAQRFAQMSKVNQAESNANVQIANRERLTNSQIAMGNTGKLNQNLVDNLDRDMTQQSEQMFNLYDVGNKIAALRAFDTDATADARRIGLYDKVDYTGATNRMLKNVFPTKDKEQKKYGGVVASIASRKLNYKPIM